MALKSFQARLESAPTRVIGYRAIDEVWLDAVATARQQRLVVAREYRALAENLDDQVLMPAWVAFAAARNGSE